jgi:S-adenosylmethionine uptake transporter
LFGIVLLLQPSFTAGTGFAALLGLISGMLAGLAIFEVNQLGKKGKTLPVWCFGFFSLAP